MTRCASPASVTSSHHLRGSTTQAALVPGLPARLCSIPPYKPGQRLGSSHRPNDIGDGSLEMQALEALDLGQMLQPCIGDPVATPTWEQDPSSIGARPACQLLLFKKRGRSRYNLPKVQFSQPCQLGQALETMIGDVVARPAPVAGEYIRN